MKERWAMAAVLLFASAPTQCETAQIQDKPAITEEQRLALSSIPDNPQKDSQSYPPLELCLMITDSNGDLIETAKVVAPYDPNNDTPEGWENAGIEKATRILGGPCSHGGSTEDGLIICQE